MSLMLTRKERGDLHQLYFVDHHCNGWCDAEADQHARVLWIQAQWPEEKESLTLHMADHLCQFGGELLWIRPAPEAEWHAPRGSFDHRGRLLDASPPSSDLIPFLCLYKKVV